MSWKTQVHPRCSAALIDKLWESAIQERRMAIDLYHAGREVRNMKCNISMKNIFCWIRKAALRIDLRERRPSSHNIIQALIHLEIYLIRVAQAHQAAMELKACHQGTRICRFTIIFCTVNAFMMLSIKMKILTKTWVMLIPEFSVALDHIIRSAYSQICPQQHKLQAYQ